MRARPLAASLLAALTGAAAARAAKPFEWPPIDPADLAATASTIDPIAAAEVISWRVRIDDGGSETHALRVKVFDARVVESQARVEITHGRSVIVDQVVARTVHPDGSVHELGPAGIFHQTAAKVGRRAALDVTTLQLPAVIPGSVLDTTWRERRGARSLEYAELPLAREIPVREVTYELKPLSVPGLGMRARSFSTAQVAFKTGKDGFARTTVRNLPAHVEEPYMPPVNMVRPWILVFYTLADDQEPAKFWADVGKRMADRFRPALRSNDDIRAAAAQATAGARTPEEKLGRLSAFVQARVHRTDLDEEMTSRDRLKLKDNFSARDVLAHAAGDELDVLLLFTALARAAGFEAHVAAVADRSSFMFDTRFPDTYFLDEGFVAVEHGDAWLTYDPAETHVPAGSLRWQEEGQDALLWVEGGRFVRPAVPPPDASKVRRTAALRLSEDGRLEGTVHVELAGHRAEADRRRLMDAPVADRARVAGERAAAWAGVAVTDVMVESLEDPTQPLGLSCRVRLEGHAARTGKRLFLQPSVLQANAGPKFPASTRRHPISFNYPWSERDVIDIEIPDGWSLESPDVPGPLRAEDVAAYELKLWYVPSSRTLRCQRTFSFGGGGVIQFPADAYPALKQFFDAVHERDHHAVTLRMEAGS